MCKYSLGVTKFDKWHNQFFYGCCCCFRENNYYWLSSCRSKRMKWTKLINTTCYLSLSDFSKFRLSLIAPCSCTVSRKKNTQPSFAFWPFYDDFNRLLTTISKDHWVPRMLFALLTLNKAGFFEGGFFVRVQFDPRNCWHNLFYAEFIILLATRVCKKIQKIN